MDEARLKQLEKLCKAATAAPWQTRFIYRMFIAARENAGILMGQDQETDWPNSEFIAESIIAIPELIAEIRRLQDECESGFEEGREEGYDTGYDDGYNRGWNLAKEDYKPLI